MFYLSLISSGIRAIARSFEKKELFFSFQYGSFSVMCRMEVSSVPVERQPVTSRPRASSEVDRDGPPPARRSQFEGTRSSPDAGARGAVDAATATSSSQSRGIVRRPPPTPHPLRGRVRERQSTVVVEGDVYVPDTLSDEDDNDESNEQ